MDILRKLGIKFKELTLKRTVDGNVYFVVHDGTSDKDVLVNVNAVKTYIQQGGIGNEPVYTGLPANINVGGVTNGFDPTGLTFSEAYEKLIRKFVSPSFASFGMQSQSTLFEVGDPIQVPALRTFTWSFNNEISDGTSKIKPTSISIKDVTFNNIIATGLTNDYIQQVDVGTIYNTTPINRTWQAKAIDIENNIITSGEFNIRSIYPYFWGKSSSVPSITQSIINTSNKTLLDSNQNIIIPFNAVNEYIWFAIPTIYANKTNWKVTDFSKGDIGTSTDLFGAFSTIMLNSPTNYWTNVSYKIYISNYPTSFSNIGLNN